VVVEGFDGGVGELGLEAAEDFLAVLGEGEAFEVEVFGDEFEEGLFGAVGGAVPVVEFVEEVLEEGGGV
jgi:hypothetical protein